MGPEYMIDAIKDVSDEELLIACEHCMEAKTCGKCQFHPYINCTELDSEVLHESLIRLKNLRSEHTELDNKHKRLSEAYEKSQSDFWVVHNNYLKDTEEKLLNQILMYLSSLDSIGSVSQTEIESIIKKTIESGYVHIA